MAHQHLIINIGIYRNAFLDIRKKKAGTEQLQFHFIRLSVCPCVTFVLFGNYKN